MILKLEENLSQKEIEVLIRYAHRNAELERLIVLVRSADKVVRCKSEQGEKLVRASEIYYIESVDKRTFVYCRDEVYQSELRLYQILEELSDIDFVQVSKSCIINIQMLDCVKPLFNSRLEVTLNNQERVNATRKFVPLLKEKLKQNTY